MTKVWYTALYAGLLFLPAYGRVLRSAGTFNIDTTQTTTTIDPYSGPFIPERADQMATLRVRLRINTLFSLQSLQSVGCRVLNHTKNSVFIQCKAATIDQIAALPGVERCSVSRTLLPLLDSARNQSGMNFVHGTAAPSPLPSSYTGKGVLCGIVDTEFDTHHPAFLDSSGETRFIALWDQFDSTGAKKNRFGYGTIKDHSGLVADSSFGMATGNHGTHTASIMAGSNWKSGYVGAAPGAVVAAVRHAGSEELSDALAWIFSIADSLKMPCVINVSLGVALGPHDGTSHNDRVIDSLSGPGRIVVGAIGNDGAIPSHIKFDLDANDTGRTWVWPHTDSLPGDSFEVRSAIDLWGEAGEPFTTILYLLDYPTGRYIKSATGLSTSRKLSANGIDSIVWRDSVLGTVELYYSWNTERASESNQKPHCFIYTFTQHPTLVLGVELINNSTTATTLHGWNPYHQMFHHFSTPGFSQGDSLYSVNELGGTSKRNITVGGYIGRTALPLWQKGETTILESVVLGSAWYSSGFGPTVDGRVKPDITAPSWFVVAAISRMAPRDFPEVVLWPDTSTTNSRYAGHTGTSMASPFVAGTVALMLEAKPDLTPEEAKTILQETAIKDGFTGSLTTFSNQWGAGKINAAGAMTRLLGIKVEQRNRVKQDMVPLVKVIGRQIILSASPREIARVTLYDMFGRTVITAPLTSKAAFVLPETISEGWYIAHVTSGSLRITIAITLLSR